MGLTAEDYAGQLQALLPPGKVYDCETDSAMYGLLLAMADELARLDAAGLALLEEADPRTASALFSGWENDYGLPDLCSSEVPDTAVRRGLLLEKISRLGAQTPAYFIHLAELLGYSVTVTEVSPYSWRVVSVQNTVRRWTVRSPVIDPLSSWNDDVLECTINRAKPAHTFVQFSYFSDAEPGEGVLLGARIFVDWSDAANNSGRYAKNQNDGVTPSDNIIAFPTGSIVNESGSANPGMTNFYGGAVDPSGWHNATRVLTTAANQVLYFHRSSASGALPAGTYTLRFRARSRSGTGSWAISFGSSSGYASGTVQDLDWTDPANDAATTFTATFTNPANDIACRFTTSGSDVLIDRIQLYEGSSGSVPVWTAEHVAGGRRAFGYANSIPLTADDNADTTGLVSGMLLIDPLFPGKFSYTGYTVMTVQSLDALPGSGTHLINIHPGDGGTTTANAIICESTSPYVGEVNASAVSSSRADHAWNVAGDGIFIAGHGRSATHRKVWLDTVPVLNETKAFSGINVSRWAVGSFNTANVSELRNNLAAGDYCYTVVWDRLLTDTEYKDAANALRARLATRGVSMLTMTDVHHLSGDSNGQMNATDWSRLLTQENYFSPKRNLMLSNSSEGGKGINHLERDYGVTETLGGLTDATITANGRYALHDKPALLGAVENGRYALYHLPIGTNDWDIIDAYSGTNAQKASAYCARVQTFITNALNDTHARVHVMWYSLLPQTSTSRPNWEAQRLLVNSEMATWIASQSRVHLCDFGGSATIGSRALQTGGGGTYYISDEIHLSASGDTAAAAIAKAAIQAWRISVGV